VTTYGSAWRERPGRLAQMTEVPDDLLTVTLREEIR
jgi:hypothetical protein